MVKRAETLSTDLSRSTVMLCRFSSAARTMGRSAPTLESLAESTTARRESREDLLTGVTSGEKGLTPAPETPPTTAGVWLLNQNHFEEHTIDRHQIFDEVKCGD